MPDYGGTFTASYDPNLVTQTALTGPPVEYGTGEGGYGFNIDSLLAKVYDWKQRAAAMDYYRQQQGASADAQRQMAALRGSAAIQDQMAEAAQARQPDPMRRQIQAKEYLDKLAETNPRFGHGNNLDVNKGYLNLPAAQALALGSPYPTGAYDLYKSAAESGEPTKQAGENMRQKELINAGYRVQTGGQ